MCSRSMEWNFARLRARNRERFISLTAPRYIHYGCIYIDGQGAYLMRKRFADILNHLFSIGQEHHRLIHVEYVVINTGITNPAH